MSRGTRRLLLLALLVFGVGGAGAGAPFLYLLYLWDREQSTSIVLPPLQPKDQLARVTSEAIVGTDRPGVFPGTPLSRRECARLVNLSEAKICGQAGCHPDITRAWEQSMHHLATFNNPFYRKAVDYTRERQGDAGVRWCAGCHDPVLLLTGKIDGPVTPDMPGADAGVTCLICHAIDGIQDLTGNGRYSLSIHDTSFLEPDNPLRGMVGLLLKIYPQPHKNGFLKALHRQPEFCSTCHRVGLGPAQNHYRWFRGQDQYGGWLNGGASGRVARSFRTPKTPQRCQDCHMPLVASKDAGNRNGLVHLHAFPGANAAVAKILGQPGQAALSEAFLRDSMRVDIVAVREFDAPDAARESKWHLPLEGARLTPRRLAVLDVVVRNLRVGHGFPEGVLDNKDVWLEVAAHDARGRKLWQQGGIGDRDRLLPTAHLYGAVLLDAAGARIDRRNINDFRVNLFRRQVGPGQADIARYRFHVPAAADAGGALTFEARLRYRKVQPDYARFTYAGRRAPGAARPPPGAPTDPGPFEVDPKVPVPPIPIVEVAGDRVTVAVGDGTAAGVALTPRKALPLLDRLVDYGVGLLLQQDDRRTRAVFERVRAEYPDSVDGQVGLARDALQRSDDAAAIGPLEEALARLQQAQPGAAVDPGAYARIQALLGQALAGQGEYARAILAYREALARYPLDRSLYADLGLALFQNGEFEPAVQVLRQGLTLEPDDLLAHLTLARSYQALGRSDEALIEQQIFDAMREDTENQGMRQKYLEDHPEDLLETINGHEHQVD